GGGRRKPTASSMRVAAMRRRDVLLILPAAGIVLATFAVPMVLLVLVSFWSVKSYRLRPDLSLAAWERFVTEYGTLTVYTLGVGVVAGAICTGAGLTFAYAARFKAGRLGDTLMIAVLITLFGGYLVKVYAWKTILGSDGIVNGALIGLGIIDAPAPWLIYSRGTVVIALVNFLLPFAILPIYAAMRNIPDVAVEAARDLGATAAQTFLKVILPLARTS